jgi:hypothetical protein
MAFLEYVNIQLALDLTNYLDKEDENAVWTTVFNNIRHIYRILLDQPASTEFNVCNMQSLLITKIIRDPVIIVSLARIAFAAVLFETSRTSAWTSGMGANAVRLSGRHNPSISTYGLGVCFKIN